MLFSTEERRKLVGNFAALTALQVIVYLFPLLTIPYLLVTIGAERYGLIAFGQALVFYFVMFTDYGFNLSATKDIAVKQNDKEAVAKIFSQVTAAKLVLIVIAFVIYITLVLIFPRFRSELLFYLLFFGVVIGQALFPVWLFQGLEKMYLITVIQIIGKLLYTLPIFILVKEPAHYIRVIVISALSFLVMGFLGLAATYFQLKVKFYWPTAKGIKTQFKEGFLLFITNLNTNIYKNINPILLGLLTTNEFVAYYSAAEKIIKALQSVASPLTQVVYPRISNRVSAENTHETIRIILRLVKFYTVLLIPCCILLFVLIDKMIAIFFTGSYSPEVLRNIRIMIPTIYLNAVIFLLGVVGLINLKMQKQLTAFVCITGVVHIVVTTILILIYHDIGASIGFLLSDIFLFTILVIYFLIQGNRIKKVTSKSRIPLRIVLRTYHKVDA